MNYNDLNVSLKKHQYENSWKILIISNQTIDVHKAIKEQCNEF